jgi:hypothetical protein
LGTFVNDNVTFGEANRQKALNGKSKKTPSLGMIAWSLGWWMESWMVHGGAETTCMMRDTLRVVVSLSPVMLQARVDCVHN